MNSKEKRKNYDILVIRINREGKLCNSRPCNQCIITLKNIGVKKVYYSNDDGKIIHEKLGTMQMLHVCQSLKLQKFNIRKLSIKMIN